MVFCQLCLKNLLYHDFTSKKLKIDFYSCEEVFVRSGYCKLLLNKGYTLLFLINMNFYVSIFQLLPNSPT